MKKNSFKKNGLRSLLIVVLSFFIGSCSNNDELRDPSFDNLNNELALTLSDSTVTLTEQMINGQLNFTWSTGTNFGTGQAISYTLEIDRQENDFSNPLITFVDHEKNNRSFSIDYGTFNESLLQAGMQVQQTYNLQARVVTTLQDSTSAQAQQAVVPFQITTFKPVSSDLFLLGDATPNGWDISNATVMQASTSQRGVFTYQGQLTSGNFKFAVNQDGCFCQDFYTRDPNDEEKIVYNESGSGDDLQWTIEESGLFKVTVDLINKTFKMSKQKSPAFSVLYMVGNATESGWNVDDPVAMVQDEENPFEFTYEGNFVPGEFKIFAGPLGDFCGQWYRPIKNGRDLINEEVLQNTGCEDDNKWLVTEENQGRYKIILNTANNTIRFTKINLYIVGDGGPNGWNVATPEPMAYDNGTFVFNGQLGGINPTGEFKISMFTGGFCDGEWINSANPSQSISNTDFIYTNGCNGPDNKWKLQDGDAGIYEIRIDLSTKNISIAPQ